MVKNSEKEKADRLQQICLLADRYAFPQVRVKARTVLLKAGQKASRVYFVKQGGLRLWMDHNGREITNQFFFEGGIVASLESMFTNQPSDFYLETIEDSTLYVLEKKKFGQLWQKDPEFKDWFHTHMISRFIYYSRHLLSFLRDKPESRYSKLLINNPEVILRVPQHYIASYLGITPVSLSRIRSKLLREEKNKQSPEQGTGS